MIERIEINNFKSLKEVILDCSKINIFIGEPNSGKTNILEALGLLSFCAYSPGSHIGEFVRFEGTSNLFYDEDVMEPILINIDEIRLSLGFENGNFKGDIKKGNQNICQFGGNYNKLNVQGGAGDRAFKFYKFIEMGLFDRQESDFLLPPSGKNLMSLLSTHKDLRMLVNRLCSPTGLTLGIRPRENRIDLVKKMEDIIYVYPYSAVSDTFRRLIFYLAAIQSNKKSVLVFDEPAAHAFPLYIKYLAEKIASDIQDNQYFITTHNPYFLLSIVEKAFPDEVTVFVTYFHKYQTKIKPLSRRKTEQLMAMDVDVFFDLDKLIGKK